MRATLLRRGCRKSRSEPRRRRSARASTSIEAAPTEAVSRTARPERLTWECPFPGHTFSCPSVGSHLGRHIIILLIICMCTKNQVINNKPPATGWVRESSL